MKALKTGLAMTLLVTSTALNAQKAKGSYSAKFEDGVVVNYSLYQDRGDELFTRHITAISLANDIGITNEISYSSLVPEKFIYKAGLYAGLMSGFGGITASGTYYLGSGEKKIENAYTVKSFTTGSTTTRYKVKMEGVKVKYWGINAELAYHQVNYEVGNEFHATNGGYYNITKASYGLVAAGIGYNSMKGGQIKVADSDGGYIGGSRLFTAVADVAFYPGFKTDAVGIDSIGLSQEFDHKEAADGSVGFRVYVQSQNTVMYHKKSVPKGCIGFTWRLGLIKSVYTNAALSGMISENVSLTPLFGLGVFYTFY